MEKKLLTYYQSLVKPVEPWGPFYETQSMLDGTDVDAQISRKRAHKNIMDEAVKAEQRNRLKFRMRSKKKSVDRDVSKSQVAGGA